MEEGRRPLMADVAERAGVSTMTVSRVLNGFPGVADETRRRVEAAVEELGYQAHAAARVLAGGRSRTLGVVVVESDHFGPSHMLFGLEAAAREAGHLLNVVSLGRPDGDDLRSTLDHLRGVHVEGVVVLAPVQPVIDALAHLDDPALPLVVIGGDPATAASTVTIDQHEGARAATAHLLGLGHRTVHHIAGPAPWVDAAERRRGWADALTEPGDFVAGDWSARGGYEAGLALAADPAVTAVFAANDQTALGLLRALHERGRSVPGDVSVVGFDDTPESAFLVPPLTTVRQDFDEVGRRCVETLLAHVDGAAAPRHVVVPPALVIRSSTAPPPTR